MTGRTAEGRERSAGARRSASLLAIAAALGLAGCASSGGGGNGASAQCRSDLPRDERPLGEVLDSVAVQRAVADAWEPGAGLTLARISYDSVGESSGASLLSASLTDEARGRMKGLVEAHAPERWWARQQIHLFLGDASGPAVRRVARFGGCAPEITNREIIQRRITELSRSFGIRHRMIVRLNVQVLHDGNVGEIRIEQSSGDPQLDLATAQFFREVAFRPAMVEGIGVETWAAFPITYAPSGSGGPQRRSPPTPP